MGAVPQHNTAKFIRGPGSDDLAFEPFLHQFWYQAAMVDVRMGKEKVVDISWRIMKCMVPFLYFLAALEHAAIYEDVDTIALQEE
jgi:hypothetical protein